MAEAIANIDTVPFTGDTLDCMKNIPTAEVDELLERFAMEMRSLPSGER